MSAWFHRPKYTIIRNVEKKETKIPEGMWVKCDRCDSIILTKELADNLNVCPKCGLHKRVTAKDRVAMLVDEGTFNIMFEDVQPVDYLNFPQYKDKLEKSKKATGLSESVITGTGKMNGLEVALGVTDFLFMGGSLGSVMGERLTSLCETAISNKLPVIIVSASGGGARMHEGIISLMQMAKISAALSRVSDAGLPFISVMTDPTGGGVTASFAMLGDLNVAEPEALIMFAGPRVIEQTIRQKLPEGFQRSEFLLEHGMIDIITERKDMKNTIHSALSKLMDSKRYSGRKIS
ncbi:MAG TPA: acetyl-CoA carboxylase, carboxyltransferase subunit beta [Candidatus Goldiibacteriota bacterium]|nr:acetyl-CoA carboxylase, carboxyltransferase subunit beta [Candidatus Goldiibacteriota bacterium]HPN64881.1 acetyl-CoA carboxylase, carboxyltransferase subunit beta [Candidatus Goldiibacteriota bacterium]HRQ43492.1 acetyl-CoA carboxylase, carboxyltransferase subunit beta [Candidatus Goldiibacteriota bacterium]